MENQTTVPHQHSEKCTCGAGHSKCNCPHHKVPGIAVALIAVVFFLNALGIVSWHVTSLVWPVLLFIAAGTKAFGNKCGCC